MDESGVEHDHLDVQRHWHFAGRCVAGRAGWDGELYGDGRIGIDHAAAGQHQQRTDSGTAPGTQTVAPGQLATYTLTVNNPTSAAMTYNLAVTGVNPSWVTLQPSVTVAANGSTNVPLTLRSTLADLAGTYNFMVTATSGGTSGAVEGTMILVGASGTIGAVGSSNTLGVPAC